MSALIQPIHDVLVGPFEVEGVVERLAHTLILELLAPRVEEPALSARHCFVGQLLALDAAVAESREIIASGPEARGELLVEQIVLALEPFQRDIAIAIELPAQNIEVVEPARRRQVGAPPALHPLVLDEAP